MYDELVERLRDDEAWKNCDFDFIYGWMHEAADAIEQLGEYADTIGRLKYEGWYLQETKYHDGYQAIATMPLPQPPKEG